MTISEMVKKAHDNAVNHGFWENPPEFGTVEKMAYNETRPYKHGKKF